MSEITIRAHNSFEESKKVINFGCGVVLILGIGIGIFENRELSFIIIDVHSVTFDKSPLWFSPNVVLSNTP